MGQVSPSAPEHSAEKKCSLLSHGGADSLVKSWFRWRGGLLSVHYAQKTTVAPYGLRPVDVTWLAKDPDVASVREQSWFQRLLKTQTEEAA